MLLIYLVFHLFAYMWRGAARRDGPGYRTADSKKKKNCHFVWCVFFSRFHRLNSTKLHISLSLPFGFPPVALIYDHLSSVRFFTTHSVSLWKSGAISRVLSEQKLFWDNFPSLDLAICHDLGRVFCLSYVVDEFGLPVL